MRMLISFSRILLLPKPQLWVAYSGHILNIQTYSKCKSMFKGTGRKESCGAVNWKKNLQIIPIPIYMLLCKVTFQFLLWRSGAYFCILSVLLWPWDLPVTYRVHAECWKVLEHWSLLSSFQALGLEAFPPPP